MGVYEVHVSRSGRISDSDTRFEVWLDEAPAVNDLIPHGGVAYVVRKVLPETDRYDGIIEAELAMGPPEPGTFR